MNIEQGKTYWSEEDLGLLRATVRETMLAYSISQSTVGAEAQVGASTISQFLNDTYPGDMQAVAKKVARWISTKQAEALMLSVAPPEPTFTRTRTADQVTAVLRSAQALSDIGIVTGPPGVGKTASAIQYVATTTRVAIATASPAIATTSAILQQLIRARGDISRVRSNAPRLEMTILARSLFQAGSLIIIDEAQHLQMDALEELRAIHDDTRAGLVLMGNDKVLSRIEGNERAASFAQLYSRAGVRVKLTGSTPADIEAVLATMSVTDRAVTASALEIGAKDNLRVVVKAVRRALMIAQADKENLAPNHLRLAYRQLGGRQVRG